MFDGQRCWFRTGASKLPIDLTNHVAAGVASQHSQNSAIFTFTRTHQYGVVNARKYPCLYLEDIAN
jgi:hypothetical protein